MKEQLRKINTSMWLAELGVIILALFALRKDNPYAYYVLLKWIACPLFAWIAWKSFSLDKNVFLTLSASLMALLINPLLRIHLERERWELINIVMIAVALWSLLHSVSGLGKKC